MTSHSLPRNSTWQLQYLSDDPAKPAYYVFEPGFPLTAERRDLSQANGILPQQARAYLSDQM
jgi:hypothetical protein